MEDVEAGNEVHQYNVVFGSLADSPVRPEEIAGNDHRVCG
jgi:hypothetical protein